MAGILDYINNEYTPQYGLLDNQQLMDPNGNGGYNPMGGNILRKLALLRQARNAPVPPKATIPGQPLSPTIFTPSNSPLPHGYADPQDVMSQDTSLSQEAAQEVGGMPNANPAQTDQGGILGNFLSDPKNIGFLSASASLLESSGPSPTPISLGQAIGRGVTAGVGGYSQGKNLQIMETLRQAQLSKALKESEPDAIRTLRAVGVDPNSPEGKQLIVAKMTKPQTSVNIAGDRAFAKGLGDEGSKEIFKMRTAAQDAAFSLNGVSEAKKLLDAGIKSGAFADYKVGLGKVLQQVGVNYDADAIANSEAFVAAQSKQVASIIKSFGAGTGLSDADREFAIKAAGGDIKLTEPSIRRILDINERAYRNLIKNYNKTLSSVPKEARPFEMGIEEPAGILSPSPGKPTNGNVRVVDW